MKSQVFLLCALFLSAGACQGAPDKGAGATPQASQKSPAVRVAKKASSPSTKLPPMLVHKSPTCGCCESWVEHMRKAGFAVEVRNSDDLVATKQRLGVPRGHESCHTAEVGGYVIEGHVPAGDVLRLLAQKPDAKGLALPGMPMGSPGMEMPDGRRQPYTVEIIGRDGTTATFAEH